MREAHDRGRRSQISHKKNLQITAVATSSQSMANAQSLAGQKALLGRPCPVQGANNRTCRKTRLRVSAGVGDNVKKFLDSMVRVFTLQYQLTERCFDHSAEWKRCSLMLVTSKGLGRLQAFENWAPRSSRTWRLGQGSGPRNAGKCFTLQSSVPLDCSNRLLWQEDFARLCVLVCLLHQHTASCRGKGGPAAAADSRRRVCEQSERQD